MSCVPGSAELSPSPGVHAIADALSANTTLTSLNVGETELSEEGALLIVRADNLYDPRLLRRIATAPFGTSRGLKAFALVDSTPATMDGETPPPRFAPVHQSGLDASRTSRLIARCNGLTRPRKPLF